eukprot:Awhi_evm1s9445
MYPYLALLSPVPPMYTIVMNNCVKSKEYDIVLDMFQEMKAMGLPLGVVTYTTVLPAVRAGQ